MTNADVSAFAQQETVIEKVYREVFLQSDHRFALEVKKANGIIERYVLYSVSKHLAQQEAKQKITQIIQSSNDERMIWRITGGPIESIWRFEAMSINPVPSTEKKPSLWSRFIDYFFQLDED